MPWEQVTVLEQRQEFVMLARVPGVNISELSRRFGISRKTAYKWLSRHEAGQAEALLDRSRRPKRSPRQSPADIEQAVLAVRGAHAAWGGRKIAHVLARDRQQHVAPSTVTSILHRHGLIDPQASAAATPFKRFEHEQPNELWQMDFKGHFAVGAQRCHPLTVIDDHSRYNLVLTACGNEQRLTVQTALQRAFTRYGLPQRINTDNGAPWGTAGQGGLTAFELWLIRLGIGLSHSRPLHPQTNGKDERFHRSLKAEVLAWHRFDDLAQVQVAFDRWRGVYNRERPHEALSMQTPAQRYRPSSRPMPSTLPPIEYGPDDSVRKVQQGGFISWRNRQIRLSRALVGQPVALRPSVDEDGIYRLYYCHQYIQTLDLRATDAD
jgi:transposase InsO family protein